MENVLHNTATSNEAMEPPDLPDGWRSAELVEWKDPYLTASRRARAVRIAVVVIIVALVVGVLLWIADTHYARGVAALEDHAYSTAVSEFSVARVLVFPYRDARSLEEQARRALQAEDARYEKAEARRAAAVALLEKAGARLEVGDPDGVRSALQAIKVNDFRAALNRSDSVREAADALALDLAAAARRSLGNAAWGRAGKYAAALLVLEPSSDLAVALAARARTGAELGAKLGKAKAAAQGGEWRTALRIALAVIATQKDFPGAAAVVADARDALAPKPKPKPAATQPAPVATTVASPPQAGGGSGTTNPPQPPPP